MNQTFLFILVVCLAAGITAVYQENSRTYSTFLRHGYVYSRSSKTPNTYDCDQSNQGNTWWDGDFQLKCDGKKYKAIDCRTRTTEQPIGVGNSLTEGDCTYKCSRQEDYLHFEHQCVRGSASCNMQGNGKTVWRGQFEVECVVEEVDGWPMWSMKPKNCRTSRGTVFPFDTSTTEETCHKRCFLDGGQVLKMTTTGDC